MKLLTRDTVGFRTKLLPLERAESFARCLRGNERFADVQVQESPRSPGKWFVAFTPSDEGRRQYWLEQAQTERQARSDFEGLHYTYLIDPSGSFYWCFSVSGELYDVTPHSCSCPDFQFRCSGHGIYCKHILALYRAVNEGRVNDG
jgi:hypothetical protein